MFADDAPARASKDISDKENLQSITPLLQIDEQPR